MLFRSYKKAEKILTEHIDKLHAVAKVLLDKEKVTGEEFNAIIEGRPLEELNKKENAVDLEKHDNVEETHDDVEAVNIENTSEDNIETTDAFANNTDLEEDKKEI